MPIIRNMAGLTSDSKPHPSIKVGRIKRNTPQEVLQHKMEVADALEKSLDEWWENEKMQSALQKTELALYTYADYYWFPYWNEEKQDVCIEPISPRRVHRDPNCDNIADSDYVVIDFFRSRSKMYSQFGEEKCKDLNFSDFKEIVDGEYSSAPNEESQEITKVYRNVCKLELYMERE